MEKWGEGGASKGAEQSWDDCVGGGRGEVGGGEEHPPGPAGPQGSRTLAPTSTRGCTMGRTQRPWGRRPSGDPHKLK